MSQRTYFQNPRHTEQWVVTIDHRERARLRRRGWRKVLVRDIPSPLYAELKHAWSGHYTAVRVYPETARRNQTCYRLARVTTDPSRA